MDDSKKQNEPSAAELEMKALTLRSEMAAIKIVDQPSYDLAVAARTRGASFLKEADAFFDPNIKKAHELHKGLLAQKKSVTDPVERTMQAINSELVRFDREEEAKRQAEQKRIEEEARRQAEEQRLADAEHMVSQGVDQDDALEMVVQEPVAVAAPVVAPRYEKSKAVSFAKRYSGVVDDIKKVIEAAAGGNVNARQILEVNGPRLNQLAMALKEGLAESVPGTRAVENTSVRSGRG